MPKSASFDIIGTCFTFDHPIQAIHSRLAPILTTTSTDAKTLFFAWFYAAQRDFTYLSLTGSYVPIAQILRATFKRACLVVDIPAHAVSDEDVDAVMRAFGALRPREGLKDCFDGLRGEGWLVLGVTNGAVGSSLGYFREAGVVLGEGDLVSCDVVGFAKPDGRVYGCALERLGRVEMESGSGKGDGEEDGKEGDGDGDGKGERWFVAAHAWDLVAARKAGFKTAYLDFEEHDPVTEVFGEFDLYAASMEELLRKLREVG
ncbi:hypothetical protein FKW77_006585 [Venturia effusa]|uniref:Haloacid dehalogenase, type II n=1 Tax=Venturia effusa TaxID=50376 RepID=A0A517LFP4_9PEZI|nr:hypothetical protein FKW77_006585 [Venturia effusa]